ncbi:MAG TPA: toll/interleukin-1 receptor domain-containing protein [bacterium]|jgi:hypothetical protein
MNMVNKEVNTDQDQLNESPLVFLSHDSRDSELAEAFSALIKNVSAGMLNTFFSSSMKGGEGIDIGADWYGILMNKLDRSNDVVCIITERSLNRPWILFEAGVAKAKLERPVLGLALGVPLTDVNQGPFYHFQNSDDSVESLSKLVVQLCERVPRLRPSTDSVNREVAVFCDKTKVIIEKLGGSQDTENEDSTNSEVISKVLEEMKIMVRDLPSRFESMMSDFPGRIRSRKFMRFSPMMFEDVMHMFSKELNNPVGFLIIASIFKDEMPWLYELGLEAYRAIKIGRPKEAFEAIESFQESVELSFRSPIFREMGMVNKEMHMYGRELPHFLRRYLMEFGFRTNSDRPEDDHLNLESQQ